MKLSVVLLATIIGCVWSVDVLHPEDRIHDETWVKKVDDRTVLTKQKDVLRLLLHVQQPIVFEDQIEIAKAWSIQSNLELYENKAAVKEFVRLVDVGLLKRGEIFTIFDKVHRRQAIALFHTFYYAKTWDTFYKTAVWARQYVNERMFVYALTLAVTHRADCKGIVLPPIYEIIPNYFVNSKVMHTAHKYKMENFAYLERDNVDSIVKPKMVSRWNLLDKDIPIDTYRHSDDTWSHVPVKNIWHKTLDEKHDVVLISANYTADVVDVDADQLLSYFLEDVGLNAFYYYLHIDSPFWMTGKKFGIDTLKRGERYYWIHKQLLARYYLERLSHNLGDIELLNVWDKVLQKYVPLLSYENGVDFPIRNEMTKFVKDDDTLLDAEMATLIEKRILDAIDLGYVLLDDGTKVSLLTDEGMNILGNLVEGNGDSINLRFYKYLHIIMKLLIGNVRDVRMDIDRVPSVLEHYETMLRDPAFWKIYKKIVLLMDRLKANLPTYTYDELIARGVKIDSVLVDKLVTFFEPFDVELNNGIYTDLKERETIKYLVKARQTRLNHKPFKVAIKVNSEVAMKVAVRVFIGPKFDEKGHEIDIRENRHNYVLLHKFVTDIPAGQSVIERESVRAERTTIARTPLLTLYKKVMGALDGTEDFVTDVRQIHCGFPQHLLIPRGKKGGMDMRLFVIISPVVKLDVPVPRVESEDAWCGIRNEPLKEIDHLPLGFPFDRPIDITVFRLPNMIHKDIKIYHKELDEVMTNYTH